MPTGSTSSVARVQEAEIPEGPIDPPKTPADVKQEPGALPAGFEWSLIDIKNEEQVSAGALQWWWPGLTRSVQGGAPAVIGELR